MCPFVVKLMHYPRITLSMRSGLGKSSAVLWHSASIVSSMFCKKLIREPGQLPSLNQSTGRTHRQINQSTNGSYRAEADNQNTGTRKKGRQTVLANQPDCSRRQYIASLDRKTGLTFSLYSTNLVKNRNKIGEIRKTSRQKVDRQANGQTNRETNRGTNKQITTQRNGNIDRL